VLNANQFKDVLAALEAPAERKRLLATMNKERGELTARLAQLDHAVALLSDGSPIVNGNGKAYGKAAANSAAPVRRRRHNKPLRAHILTTCQNPECPRKGKQFRAKKRGVKYCSGPCSWWHYRETKGKAKAARKAEIREKRSKALEKARVVLKEQRRTAKREATRGHTLIAGDPLNNTPQGEATH